MKQYVIDIKEPGKGYDSLVRGCAVIRSISEAVSTARVLRLSAIAAGRDQHFRVRRQGAPSLVYFSTESWEKYE
jgi:hypothetical protein